MRQPRILQLCLRLNSTDLIWKTLGFSLIGAKLAGTLIAPKPSMKGTIRILCRVATLLLLGLTMWSSQTSPVHAQTVPAMESEKLSEAEKEIVKNFTDRVQTYLKLRNGVKDKLPKLSKDATPEEIRSYMDSFEAAVRTLRAGAKRGDIFTTEASTYIRRAIAEDFKGRDRMELRKTVLQAETEGVPVRVNYPYPESKEFSEMPATLLLQLPQLPKELRYRFVGFNLLLVDRENNLIVDYMTNALP